MCPPNLYVEELIPSISKCGLGWQQCFYRGDSAKIRSLFSSVQWTAAHQAPRSITNSQSLLKLMSIKLVIPSNHFILCCLLLLLPSIFSSIRVLSNESILCIRWPKYWSFSFSISPSNEYSGPISFRIDWFDLLEVQGLSLICYMH